MTQVFFLDLPLLSPLVTENGEQGHHFLISPTLPLWFPRSCPALHGGLFLTWIYSSQSTQPLYHPNNVLGGLMQDLPSTTFF